MNAYRDPAPLLRCLLCNAELLPSCPACGAAIEAGARITCPNYPASPDRRFHRHERCPAREAP